MSHTPLHSSFINPSVQIFKGRLTISKSIHLTLADYLVRPHIHGDFLAFQFSLKCFPFFFVLLDSLEFFLLSVLSLLRFSSSLCGFMGKLLLIDELDLHVDLHVLLLKVFLPLLQLLALKVKGCKNSGLETLTDMGGVDVKDLGSDLLHFRDEVGEERVFLEFFELLFSCEACLDLIVAVDDQTAPPASRCFDIGG